ncbi:manganese efflux pump MntP family protein [Alicyclobacillus tolerans]|uniref:manganese efflux pump MntP n=1 Tax=Alicyclobacillus tolerans TaxID=90970 RepID=UPI001F336F20|nr:manganese efflux pump [Alicyclobacillus tolerans]MCF8567140.1 manganese efflux pump MntP family protein [Alicyclobacillus tolerans]
MWVNHVRDGIEILLMALALGMDAFSLAVGLGLNGLSRKRAFEVSLSIGVFHLFMTMAGLTAGLVVQGVMGQIAQWFGAFLLIGMGLHMLYSTLFVRQEAVSIGKTSSALLLFSAGVSVDALSVGLSLGLRSTAYGVVSAIVFGVVGGGMALLGVLIGKRVGSLIGMYGEVLGAGILIAFGLHFLYH